MQRNGFEGFANPVEPTVDELTAWAYDPVAGPPQISRQWDLLLADDRLVPTILGFAADPVCPKRTFALHCLYLYAADAVRTRFRAHPRKLVKRLLDAAWDTGDPWVRLWVSNTKALSADPDLFDYAEWCQGGLARRPRRL
ncbi:hypothetical protein [Stackebrandtia soli]|uniref:hypothetical protein n=1 Tax=Stackebrandtia soli TaxID=1892856 RepID=UPI0039E73F28